MLGSEAEVRTEFMKRCLILASHGKKGHLRQALAVARRLPFTIDVMEVGPQSTVPAIDEDIALVIGAGRQSIAPARTIARGRKPRPFVALLQPVAWRASCFDLVWAPAHDRYAAPFARRGRLETATAPSAVTAEERAAGLAEINRRLPGLAKPVVGVLIGGANQAHRFGPTEAVELAARLAGFAKAHDASLLITTSRRTGADLTALLAARLGDAADLFVDGATPDADASTLYAGILARSDAIVATADSVAMMSDVAAAGVPLYGWRLPGGKAKFERFYGSLLAHGTMRWFDGGLSHWTYPPLDAAQVIAEALQKRMGLVR